MTPSDQQFSVRGLDRPNADPCRRAVETTGRPPEVGKTSDEGEFEGPSFAEKVPVYPASRIDRSKSLCYSRGMRKTAVWMSVLLLPVIVHADPPARDVARSLGYSEELTRELPTRHDPRAPRDPGALKTSPSVDQKNWTESLPPRVYQAPEPTSMIPTLIRLHQKQPGSAKITRKLALSFMQAHQPQDALHWFTQTYMRDRKDLSALWNMGALSMQLKDYSGARAYFEEYVRLDQTSPWGRMAARYLNDGFLTFADSTGTFTGRARTGFIQSGSPSASSSIMIIDGKVSAPPAPTTMSSTYEPETSVQSRAKKPKPVTAEAMPGKLPQATLTPLSNARIDTTPAPAPAVPATPPPAPAPVAAPAPTAPPTAPAPAAATPPAQP